MNKNSYLKTFLLVLLGLFIIGFPAHHVYASESSSSSELPATEAVNFIDPNPVLDVPDDPVSTDPAATEVTPDEPLPVDPTETEVTPDEPLPADPTETEATSDEPLPADPTATEATPDEPLPADPTVIEEQTVTILHTNDVHGHGTDLAKDAENGIINYSVYKTVIDEFKAQGNTIVLDAGDVLHGTNFATLSEGQSMIDVMNAVGVQAMTPGNHDFNFGADRLIELAQSANFPILAGNIVRADGTKPFTSETIIDAGGIKVGVFGLATPETKTKSSPINTEGLTFIDTVDSARASIDKLKADGAQVIVFLSHLGTDLASDIRTQTVLDQITDIDVVIDGHSHSKYENGITHNGTFISSTGDWLKNIGATTITLTDGVVSNISAKLIPFADTTSYVADSEVVALLESKTADNDVILGEVLGETTTNLDGERANVRTKETNLANLITDAMLKDSGADLVITNGDGIRASIEAGQITRGNVLEVLPFGNQMTVIKVTGQDILDALNFGTDAAPNAAGKFPQVAGVTYTLDIENGKSLGVRDVMIGDQPLDLAKMYNLATNDFMAIGGDGYTMFEGKEQVLLHGLLMDTAANYIKELSADGPFVYTTDDRIKINFNTNVTILHTNDVHAHGTDPVNDDRNGIINYSRYKTIIDQFKANGNVIVLEAGDVLHGTNFANIALGQPMVEVMNLVGVNAMSPGNHDFNYGYKQLQALANFANFDILAANIQETDGTKPFKGETIFDFGDVKIGVFGMATPETQTKSNPANTEGLIFTDVIETAKASITSLRQQGADMIVFLSHLGTDLASPIRTETVLDQITDIDLVVDGHSHSYYPEGREYKGTTIVSTGDWLRNVGVVELSFTNGEITNMNVRHITAEEALAYDQDPEVLALLETANEKNAELLQKVVGNTATELDGLRANVRTGETNLGNIITDAMIWESGADMALTNGGGIRNSIPAGEITMNDVLEVLPFGNQLTVIEVTGQDIYDALLFGTDSYPNATGKFPHVSGMSFIVEYTDSGEIDEEGNPIKKAIGVSNILIGNEALDLNKTYKLATNDFMAVGGDGYEMFKGAPQISLHGSLADITAAYMTLLSENGPFTASIEGRVIPVEKPIDEPVEEPTDEPVKETIDEPLVIVLEPTTAYIIGTEEGLAFKVNAEVGDLISVQVDNVVVDPANYDVAAGSTIVTLKASYLATLAPGSHTLALTFQPGELVQGGTVVSNFEIAATEVKEVKDDKVEDKQVDADQVKDETVKESASSDKTTSPDVKESSTPKTGESIVSTQTFVGFSLITMAAILATLSKAKRKEEEV